jgi:hypothetical protein
VSRGAGAAPAGEFVQSFAGAAFTPARPNAVIPATNGRPESDGAMRKCRPPDSGRATLARMTAGKKAAQCADPVIPAPGSLRLPGLRLVGNPMARKGAENRPLQTRAAASSPGVQLKVSMMKVLVPFFPYADNFTDNVAVTLRAMGHEVATLSGARRALAEHTYKQRLEAILNAL